MRVTVRLLTTMRKYHPVSESEDTCELTLDKNATVLALLQELRIPNEVPKTVLVNRLHAKFERQLQDGDVISILQPVSGG